MNLNSQAEPVAVGVGAVVGVAVAANSAEAATPPPRRSHLRIALWAVALLLAGWLLPALVRLNYLQDEVAAVLSANLGRAVRVGDVHPHLVSGWDSGMGVGLGVEVENVEIADDPRFGAEALARIETLEARLAVRSIWRRRLEFSHLVLRNPSMNLARDGQGEWNLSVLLAGGVSSPAGDDLADSASRPARYPDVRIVDGRLNFKLDNRKKSAYLTGLDLDLRAPRRADQPWQIEFAATPSRASFEQVPAFVVRGTGQLGPFPGPAVQALGVPLRLNWQVRDALLGEVASVLDGSDHGTHGLVSLTGEAQGTSALLRVSGKSTISDLHRWDVIPEAVSTEIPAEFAGILDLQEDAFQLTRFIMPLRVNSRQSGLIELSGRVEALSQSPYLKLRAEARDIPLAAVLALAEPFAIPHDPALGVSGTLAGQMNLQGAPAEWDGELNLSQVELLLRAGIQSPVQSPAAQGMDSARIRLGPVQIKIAAGKFETGFVTARLSPGASAQISVQGDLTTLSHRLAIRANKVPLAQLVSWMPETALPGVRSESGSVTGNFDVLVSPGAAPEYQGRATIADATLRALGLADAIEIASARVQMRGRSFVVRPLNAKFQDAAVRGGATIRLAQGGAREPAAPLHVDFDLQISEMRLDQLAAKPVAEKDSWLGGFMRPQQPPESSVPLRASGKLKLDRLSIHGLEFSGLTGTARWDESGFALDNVSTSLAGGRVTGELELRAAGKPGAEPGAFRLAAGFRRVDVEALATAFPDYAGQFAGAVTGKLELRSKGENWEQVWRGLAGSGEIAGTNVTLARWERPAASPAHKSLALPRQPLHFSDASAKFEIANQAISILQFDAVPAGETDGQPAAREFHAAGTIGFDKAVQIAAEERLAGQAGQAQQGSQGGKLEFRWTGSLAAPQLEEPASLASNAASAPR